MITLQLLLSHLGALLAGVLIGAGVQHFGRKLAEQRRAAEGQRAERRRFEELAARMPQLFYEMRADVCRDTTGAVREFYVLENRRISPGPSPKQRFAYFETDHQALREKLDVLEAEKLVCSLMMGQTLLYRMEDSFARQLREWRPAN
jgi:hypothetical protein